MENENQLPTPGQIGLKYGLFLAAASIAFFLILDSAGLMMESWASWVGYIISIAIIVLAHNAFKSNGDGYMSFGQGFKIGLITSVVSSLVSSIFTYIYISFVNTGFIDAMREKAYSDMIDQGMDEAAIEQAMSFTEWVYTPGFIVGMGIVGGIIGGLILALIISLITKKNRPESI